MGDKVWKQITSSAEFSPRKGHKVLVFDNKLWLFGGANTDSQLLEDIWQSTDGKQWLEVKPATKLPTFNGMNNMVVFKDKIWLFAEGAFGKRHQFQSAVINEKIYVIGGEGKSNNSGELLNDVWCLE